MNLKPHLEELIEKFHQAIENADTGWVGQDKIYFEYKPTMAGKPHRFGQGETFITPVPILLNYWENTQSVTKIWFKTFTPHAKARQELKSILKPFKDEDYKGMYLYLNPDYPKGYWNNHVLPLD